MIVSSIYDLVLLGAKVNTTVYNDDNKVSRFMSF